MKTFKASRIYSETTERYRMFPDGVEDMGTIKAITQNQALHEIVRTKDDQNYFPNDDGTIQDCDGNTVFAPGDDSADFVDYAYIVEEL
jgi:hypothetical protein